MEPPAGSARSTPTTGDVGYIDDEGYPFLTDRKASVIISGGVNIYPQEIEDALALHPDVLDVAVIGVPDEEMGESVKAVVHPAPGVEPGPELADELRAFLRERIAHYKVPRSVDFDTGGDRRFPLGRAAAERLRRRRGHSDSVECRTDSHPADLTSRNDLAPHPATR